jgi:hypothetical protein
VVVRLHPEAVAEYAEAVGFYEEQAPGLGREFFDEVQRVLRFIEDNPGLGSPFEPLSSCSLSPISVRRGLPRGRGRACLVGAGSHALKAPSWLLEGAGVAFREPASHNNVVRASARFARSGVHGAYGAHAELGESDEVRRYLPGRHSCRRRVAHL